MIQPVWVAGFVAPSWRTGCGCGATAGDGSAKANAWLGVEGGTLEAGSTPSRPCPVPWFAGCGGMSVLVTSALVTSALDTTEGGVSASSVRAGGMALVTGVADWEEPADASLICAAFTWTVFTRTGFIGSD